MAKKEKELKETPVEETVEEVGNWQVNVNAFVYIFEEEVAIEFASTNNLNGNVIRDPEGNEYPSVTANLILFADGLVAVDGFEVSGMLVKIYSANGELLDTFEGFIEAVGGADEFGYSDTVAYLACDSDMIDLTAYAGQTVTVVYEFALVDSEYTVEGITIDVTVPG